MKSDPISMSASIVKSAMLNLGCGTTSPPRAILSNGASQVATCFEPSPLPVPIATTPGLVWVTPARFAAANVMTEVCAPESKTARSLTPLTSTVPVVCDFHGPPSPRSSGIAEKGLTSA